MDGATMVTVVTSSSSCWVDDGWQALQYQIETKEGKHTAPSGMWLRDFPGRLVLYPLQVMTPSNLESRISNLESRTSNLESRISDREAFSPSVLEGEGEGRGGEVGGVPQYRDTHHDVMTM